MPYFRFVRKPTLNTTATFGVANLQPILHPAPPVAKPSLLSQNMDHTTVSTGQYLLINNLSDLEWEPGQEGGRRLVVCPLPGSANAGRHSLYWVQGREGVGECPFALSWKRIHSWLASRSPCKLMHVWWPANFRCQMVIVHPQGPYDRGNADHHS